MSNEPLSQSRRIAESLFGEITWQEDGRGFCRCPGHDRHSGATGKRDCTLYLGNGKPPTVYCVHSSCAGEIADKNRALRSAIGRAEWELRRGLDPTLPAKPVLTREERSRRRRAKRHAEIGRRARAGMPTLLEKFAWPMEAITTSADAFDDDGETGWRALLGLFQPDDVLWIGDRRDSGKPWHDSYFRTAAQWLRLAHRPVESPLMSASCFRPGCHQRSRDNVVRTPFLVVESDTLARDEIGAVFQWLITNGVPLRAIIDTGGKSLHGWFDQPCAGTRRDDLLVALAAMGCDRGPWREPSMSRLPGTYRVSHARIRRQSVLWLSPQGGKVEHFPQSSCAHARAQSLI